MREQTAAEPDRFDLWAHRGYAVGSVVVHVSLNAGLWHWVDNNCYAHLNRPGFRGGRMV